MTVNEQKITEELRLMAGGSRPVDALAYASRAAAGASRRRRLSWSLAGLAVAAASVAGVFVVGSSSGFPEGRNIAAKVAGLPRNTPEQLRAVRECMPTGGPVHNMDGNRRIPEHGRAEDFRVLVEYRDRGGSTALVGSTAGFVLCTPTTQKEFAGRAVFTYWGYNPPGDLTGFSGDLNVDAYEGKLTRTRWGRNASKGMTTTWLSSGVSLLTCGEWRSTGQAGGASTRRWPTVSSSGGCSRNRSRIPGAR